MGSRIQLASFWKVPTCAKLKSLCSMHVRGSPSSPRIALDAVVPGPCLGPVGWRRASRRYTLKGPPRSAGG